MVEDWKRRAESERKSVFKFVMLRVLQSLSPGGVKGKEFLRAAIADDIYKLQEEKKAILEENEKLRQEVRMLKMLGDNLDKELKSLRAQPFLEAGFVGTRRFDKALVDLLNRGTAVETNTIFARLHIDPSDSQLVKGVRGDSRREAIDIYNHIDREELRKSYLACVPKLRV
jgi:hypothetical protein